MKRSVYKARGTTTRTPPRELVGAADLLLQCFPDQHQFTAISSLTGASVTYSRPDYCMDCDRLRQEQVPNYGLHEGMTNLGVQYNWNCPRTECAGKRMEGVVALLSYASRLCGRPVWRWGG